jgi:general stress protein 26
MSESATPAQGQNHAAALERITHLLSDADTAMLTTVADDGLLDSRPMAFTPGAFDGDLWLFADESSIEAADIAVRSSVNVSFSVPARGDFLSFAGDASLVRDPARARDLWDERLDAWFVDGAETQGLVLIRVDVRRAEYWKGPGTGVLSLFGSVRAALTRSADDPLLDTEHGHIEL